MENSSLSVKNLGVSFGDQTIFKNLNFEVKRGETTAIIGPNGAGKTVLFRALIGSISYQGEINWAEDAKIGYVPQRLDLERQLSLNLGDFLRLKVNILGLHKTVIKEVLNLVHLPAAKIKNQLSYLSSGELQRALIAFALI